MHRQKAESPHISRNRFGWRSLPGFVIHRLSLALTPALISLFAAAPAWAQEAAPHAGGEANLVVSSLSDPGTANFLGGMAGHTLLLAGILVSVLGLIFGLMISAQLN